MNKKILGFLLWGMLLLGVIYLIFFQDKNIGYQVSELIPNKEIGLSHLKGSIKNVSNNTCKEVKINVKFSNGSIKDNGWITVESPKKGEKLRFVEMAELNSKVTLENKEKDKSEILLELKDVLKLEKLPRKIETYDISNISGEYMVAAMCVMQDGVIKKNL